MTVESSPQVELPNTELSWALLERIAASSQLKNSARLCELLLYIGRRSLKDGSAHIHEQEIGCAVFNRAVGYDTALDNIVRTNVSYLRKRIEAYFDSEGAHEPFIMEIPRGSYVPVFHDRSTEPLAAHEPLAASHVSELPHPLREIKTVQIQRRWLLAGLILLLLAIGGCVTLWIHNRALVAQDRAMSEGLYAWRDRPTVSEFWSQFLDSGQDTDIVTADMSFLLLENITKESFSFNDYFSRAYIGSIQARNRNPEMRTVLDLIASKNLGNPSEYRLAHRILSLDPLNRKLHLYNAREYMPSLIAQDNVVLIGAETSNPWEELFATDLNFQVGADKNGDTSVTNRGPSAGEQKIYSPVYSTGNTVGYCVVAYLPNPGHAGKVLLIEGTSSEATEAGGNFLLSQDQLSNFEKLLHAARLPYFEVLLKTSQVRNTPFAATVAAYRIYPNMH